MANNKQTEDTFFQKISKDLKKVKNAGNVKKRVKDAMKWYTGKVVSTAPDKASVSLLMYNRRNATNFQPGQMYLFRYQSKLFEENKLAYFDAAPLILFLDVQKNGNLLGLNLHYLPPVVRAKVMSYLIGEVGAKKLRHDTKLKISWNKVQSISKLAPLQYAIKSYIPSRMHGKIVRVQPKEWHHAIFMPVAQFTGKAARGVWRDGGF